MLHIRLKTPSFEPSLAFFSPPRERTAQKASICTESFMEAARAYSSFETEHVYRATAGTLERSLIVLGSSRTGGASFEFR